MSGEREQQLAKELEEERAKSAALAREVAALREAVVRTQTEMEAEEERATNRLQRDLSESRAAQQQLAQQIEAEEELITNSLQRKLLQLRREKCELQAQLEQESEAIANRLQRQLLAAQQASATTAADPPHQQHQQQQLPPLLLSPRSQAAATANESAVRAEAAAMQLRAKVAVLERRCAEYADRCRSLEDAVTVLRRENFHLLRGGGGGDRTACSLFPAATSSSATTTTRMRAPSLPAAPLLQLPLQQVASMSTAAAVATPRRAPVPVVKLLREGRVWSRVQAASSEKSLLPCDYAVFSDGTLKLLPAAPEARSVVVILGLADAVRVLADDQQALEIVFATMPPRVLCCASIDECASLAKLLGTFVRHVPHA